MFLVDRENEQEGGRLRNGRRFQSGKRRRTITRRGSCSAIERRDYDLAPHIDGESCDEEEEYQLIYKEEDRRY